MYRTVITVVISALAGPVLAAECVSNFSVENREDGATSYSAAAPLPGENVEQAFRLSQQVLDQAGWKVNDTMPEIHTAFASHPQLAANRKSVDLTIATAMGNNEMLMAFVLKAPPGVKIPKGVVKDQFCKITESLRKQIVAAPAEATPAPAATARAASTDAPIRQAPEVKAPAARKLCLDGACLGMTLNEASKLKLEQGPGNSMQFGPSVPARGRAVSSDGQRIYVTDGGWFDNKSLAAFSKGVSTICRLQSGSFAQMKGSDGQRMELHFTPAIRNGRGILILSRIEQSLPPMSLMNFNWVQHNASEQFGAAYVPFKEVPPKDRPYAQVDGRQLTLALPDEHPGDRLMQTPGCSATQAAARSGG